MSEKEISDALQQQIKASQEEAKLQPNSDYSQKKVQSLINKKKLRTGKLDCAIIMDLTQSMDPYIEKMKQELCKLIFNIKTQNKELDVRFAFVGYKDFCDDPEVSLQQSSQIFAKSEQKPQIEFQKLITGHLSVYDFSSDIENFQNFLLQMYAEGGGDIPEDIAGALHQSLKLSWRVDSSKIIVLVSDSPTHGQQYQNPILVDDYPKGHPFGIILEDIVATYAKMKAKLLIFKITDSTEKMFLIIKEQMKSRQAKTRTIDMRKVLKREQEEKKKKKELLKTEKIKAEKNKKEEKLTKPSKKKLILNDEFDEEIYFSNSGDEDSDDGEKEDKKEEKKFDNDEHKEIKLPRPTSVLNLKIAENIQYDSGEENLSFGEEIE